MRQLNQCFGDCAPWNLDILYTGQGTAKSAFHLERPWTCTCCCFNRPVVNVLDAVTGATVGSISDPFTCCSTAFTVRDARGRRVLSADGGCCQPGLWCPCPLGPCARVDLGVTDAESGARVGHVRKRLPGCCMWLLAPDVDNYEIDFGAVRSPAYKTLLMALAIFMDFRYFNNSSRDEQSRGAALGLFAEAQ